MIFSTGKLQGNIGCCISLSMGFANVSILYKVLTMIGFFVMYIDYCICRYTIYVDTSYMLFTVSLYTTHLFLCNIFTSIMVEAYALILPHINYCLLSWGTTSAVKTIFLIQKRAIRAIFSAGYNAHTEPLFKLYNVLKVEDIYNYRLLVLYYNLKHKNVPYHIASFLPKTSIARERYPIRKSRFQPPLHAHEYISKTCKYRLPVFLNSINNNSGKSDKLKNIIDEIDNITLVKFKSVTKRYMINKYSYYCNIRNCYVCQL